MNESKYTHSIFYMRRNNLRPRHHHNTVISKYSHTPYSIRQSITLQQSLSLPIPMPLIHFNKTIFLKQKFGVRIHRWCSVLCCSLKRRYGQHFSIGGPIHVYLFENYGNENKNPTENRPIKTKIKNNIQRNWVEKRTSIPIGKKAMTVNCTLKMVVLSISIQTITFKTIQYIFRCAV